MSRRRLEKTESAATRYVEVEVDGVRTISTWGNVGAKGRRQTSTWQSAEEAAREAEKKVRAKRREGYVEVAATTPAVDVAAPAIAPPRVLDELARQCLATGGPTYDFRPIDGISDAFVSRHPVFSFYLVVSDDGTRALAMNVKTATADDAVALDCIRYVSDHRDAMLDVEVVRRFDLPAPIGQFDAILVFAADVARPMDAYPRIAKRVARVVPGSRVAQGEARLSTLRYSELDRSVTPVLDARFVTDRTKSKGGGDRFLVYARRDLESVVASLEKTRTGRLEVRNWRGDVLAIAWDAGRAALTRTGRAPEPVEPGGWMDVIDVFAADRP
jgi:predicted DNA-binding WGR domain protein